MTLPAVLDDMQSIKSIDKEGMLKIQMAFPEHCKDALRRGDAVKALERSDVSRNMKIAYKKPDNIIVAGMGGSAVGGDVLKDWLRDDARVPIEVSREYHLPAYADDRTLVLAVSYSGNTEETLSSFVEAVERRCMIIAVSSGGQLENFSQRLGTPLVKLPENLPPRAAFPYLFFPLATVLKKLGVFTPSVQEIEETIKTLEDLREEVRPETPTSRNLAKQLALEVKDHIPFVYGFGFYRSVALRMKTQFNENSKMLSKYEYFPELNHNEVVGWTEPKETAKYFVVILIRDPDEPPEIRSRIDITRRIALEDRAGKILEVVGRGRSRLSKMLSVIYLADLVSVYLAILNGVDPTPVELIDRMKSELSRRAQTADTLRRSERLTES